MIDTHQIFDPGLSKGLFKLIRKADFNKSLINNQPFATEAELNKLCQAIGKHCLPLSASNPPKGRSLNPTIESLERRFKRTGQTPADIFPRPGDLAKFIKIYGNKNKTYQYFSRYKNNKKPRVL